MRPTVATQHRMSAKSYKRLYLCKIFVTLPLLCDKGREAKGRRMKERERRIATAIPARIRLGDQWLDATIMNVSRHGMMLRMARPPGRGSYIEMRRASTIVVGRVIWAKDGKCGVRSQDAIDIPALTGDAAAAPAWKAGDADRRAVQRRSIEESAAASHIWARRFQFAVLLLAIVGGCFLILHSLMESFAVAMAKIADAL